MLEVDEVEEPNHPQRGVRGSHLLEEYEEEHTLTLVRGAPHALLLSVRNF